MFVEDVLVEMFLFGESTVLVEMFLCKDPSIPFVPFVPFVLFVPPDPVVLVDLFLFKPSPDPPDSPDFAAAGGGWEEMVTLESVS